MSLIGRFEHLPNRPRSQEARPLLEKIASQVKPIMVKHGWKVGTLAEFLPNNPALLGNNMNRGQRINLRLRPPGDPSTFYEFDQLVLVMLHELTHIVHGPHDASFYKLLAQLEEEFYDLKRKGYEGEGFHSAGHRLHGVRVNEYEGRRKGLAAAEKRLATQKAMGRGGVLGGSARHTGKTMREIVAEAAERRIKDDKTCNTVNTAEVEEEVKRAQEESVGINAEDMPVTPGHSEGVEIKASSSATPPSRPDALDGSPAPSSGKKRAATPPEVIDLTDDSPPRARKSAPPAVKSKSAVMSGVPPQWSCPTCTLLNPIASPTCDACTSQRPALPPSAAVWFCDFCGSGPRAREYWSCMDCGWVRNWG